MGARCRMRGLHGSRLQVPVLGDARLLCELYTMLHTLTAALATVQQGTNRIDERGKDTKIYYVRPIIERSKSREPSNRRGLLRNTTSVGTRYGL